MIITGLRIVNFKNYPGFNEFNFSTTSDKNVILIGGMNGSGKTTLSEAIKFCLYGPKVNGNPMSDSKYQTYVTKMWSKHHTNEPMYIEMDVELDDSEEKMKLTICRSFTRRSIENNKIIEQLSLTKDGKDIELIERNYWEYYIQHIIPAHISRYFFFDGEKIRDTIASNDSSNYLRTAIRDITGISKLDILSTDLGEVRRRLLRNDIKPSVKKRMKAIDERINSLDSDINKLHNELSTLEAEKTSVEFDIESLKTEYNRIIGIKNSERETTTNELKNVTTSLSSVSEKVSDFAYGPLIRIILKKILIETLDAADKENDSNNRNILNDYIHKKLNLIAPEMHNNGFSDIEINRMVTFLKSYLQIDTIDDQKTKTIMDLTSGQITDLRAQIEIGEEKYAFIKHLSERENLMLQKNKLERDASRYNDETSTDFDQQLSLLIDKLETVKEKISQKNGIVQAKNEDLEQARRDLTREERSLILTDRDQHAVQNIDDLMNLIHTRSDIASEHGIQLFEERLNEIYERLKNKDDMVRCIHIDSNYNIKLEGYDGSQVDIEWISVGEKGILMYSIIYSLTGLSKSRLPIIIDSPLGRMDSIHVQNLIHELYPSISSQVIILSHDREITKESLPIIEPIISKTYLLSSGNPKVQEGYFR